MDSGKVFVSSVLNTTIEDLQKERLVIRAVVDSFGFLEAWAFEVTPASSEDLAKSYLRHVEECDIFVLVLGEHVTPPVNAEWLRAKKLQKPLLIFVKACSPRSPEVADVLDALNRKYAPFETLTQLEKAAKDAIRQTLVLGLRSLGTRVTERSIRETLQDFAKNKHRVHVMPIVPVGAARDFFLVQEVEGEIVALTKATNNQTVEIPLARIAEVIPGTPSEAPSLVLSGRLQLHSLAEQWKFRPESFPPDSDFGLGRVSGPEEAMRRGIYKTLDAKRIQYCWDWSHHISDRLTNGWEVFYDEDGRYLRYVVPPKDQIFVVLRQ